MRRCLLALGLAASILPASARAASDAVLPLRVVAAGNTLNAFPLLLTHQMQFFRDAGLDVSIVNFNGAALALTAIMNGNADVVASVFDRSVDFAAKKRPLQAIFLMAQLPGAMLAVSPRAGDSIKSLSDLAGKTVGASAPGASSDFLVKYLLKKAGLDPSKVPVVGVGIGPSSIAALEQGGVSAAVLYDPAATAMVSRHPNLVVLSDNRILAEARKTFGGDYPGPAILAMQSWIASHPEECRRLALALERGLQWIHAHTPEEIAAQAAQNYAGIDPAILLEAIKHTLPAWAGNGMVDPKGAQAAVDVLSAFQPDVAAAKVDPNQIYTNVFVRQALRELRLPGAD
ncbi:MAG: ABC transporter substrate-binding protein [Acetobacteraceae bacterium]